MPYYHDANDDNKVFFEIKTANMKTVADYCGCSLMEVSDMDVFTYWGLLHDAVTWNCSKTESGRKYLENAYNSIQTVPDRNALKQYSGGDISG